MAIFGAIIGLAIFYFAVQAGVIWIIGGSIALALVGYMIGKWMDNAALKKK
jgi:VIT1/CCC1 family predicted Fe2+/Mn2+ transporter